MLLISWNIWDRKPPLPRIKSRTSKANASALKSAASMYYAKQAVETGTGSYPADKDALEALLEETLTWPTGYGYTYDATAGTVTLTTP